MRACVRRPARPSAASPSLVTPLSTGFGAVAHRLWTRPVDNPSGVHVVQVVHHVVQEVLPERQHGELRAVRPSPGALPLVVGHRVEPVGRRRRPRPTSSSATTAGSCRSYRSASAVASWSQFSNSGSSCVSSSSRRPSKIRKHVAHVRAVLERRPRGGRGALARVGAVQRGDPPRREVAHGAADGRAVDVRRGEPALRAPLATGPRSSPWCRAGSLRVVMHRTLDDEAVRPGQPDLHAPRFGDRTCDRCHHAQDHRRFAARAP